MDDPEIIRFTLPTTGKVAYIISYFAPPRQGGIFTFSIFSILPLPAAPDATRRSRRKRQFVPNAPQVTRDDRQEKAHEELLIRAHRPARAPSPRGFSRLPSPTSFAVRQPRPLAAHAAF